SWVLSTRSTTIAGSTCCPFWPMPWKTPAASPTRSCRTAAARDRTFAVAGSWIFFSEKNDSSSQRSPVAAPEGQTLSLTDPECLVGRPRSGGNVAESKITTTQLSCGSRTCDDGPTLPTAGPGWQSGRVAAGRGTTACVKLAGARQAIYPFSQRDLPAEFVAPMRPSRDFSALAN